MKVITTNILIDGGTRYEPGEEIDMDEKKAESLLKHGVVMLGTDAVQEEESEPEPEPESDPEPEPEPEQKKPARRGRKPKASEGAA
jgi:hypothetical protein